MNSEIRKNLLDLHFQKYLVIASTSVILGFTYLIGVGIAVITNQINFEEPLSWIILAMLSMLFLSLISVLFFRAAFHIKNILRIIRELN